MRTAALVFVISVLTLAGGVEAKDFGEHGGYEIAAMEGTSESDRGGCVMAEDDFEGPGGTRLRVFRYVANPQFVAVTVDNYNWTANADETYALTYDLDDSSYERDAKGIVDGIHHGFVAVFPQDDFMNLLAKSDHLHIWKGDTLVDKLSLEGSTAGRAAFDRCWAYVLDYDQQKARERARWKSIPKDPFLK